MPKNFTLGRFDRLTSAAQEAAINAYDTAERFRHQEVGANHLLLALLETKRPEILQVVKALHIDLNDMLLRLNNILKGKRDFWGRLGIKREIALTPDFQAALLTAEKIANQRKTDVVDALDIFLAILSDRLGDTGQLFRELGITEKQIKDTLGTLKL